MDNLSSSDLDSPSKTPLFIAIAAVIVGLAGLLLGWMGFSRANDLEMRLADLEKSTAGVADLDAAVNANAKKVDQVTANMNSLVQGVNQFKSAVETDVSDIKKNLRAVAIDAGTAKKMVEELEKSGVKAAPAPAPKIASGSGSGSSGGPKEPSESGSGAPAAGKGGTYVIKSGDTLGKIAAAYNVSLTDLQAANPDVDSRRLRIGQQIVIPAAK